VRSFVGTARGNVRSTLITARCDARHPYSGGYRPGQTRPCCKSLDARSNVALTKALKGLGWRETQDGTVTCDECLAREARGESITKSEHDS